MSSTRQEPLEASIPLVLATNNTAEYQAVVRALCAAGDRGVTPKYTCAGILQ